MPMISLRSGSVNSVLIKIIMKNGALSCIVYGFLIAQAAARIIDPIQDDPKKADSKKFDPKKADLKEADPKEADPLEADQLSKAYNDAKGSMALTLSDMSKLFLKVVNKDKQGGDDSNLPGHLDEDHQIHLEQSMHKASTDIANVFAELYNNVIENTGMTYAGVPRARPDSTIPNALRAGLMSSMMLMTSGMVAYANFAQMVTNHFSNLYDAGVGYFR